MEMVHEAGERQAILSGTGTEGMVPGPRAGSHHTYKKMGLAGSVTVPVHGNRTLAPGTQRQLMPSSGLTDDDL
jgi:predicted RNA binding protein YcfA (HicA-like mRNA interferase family)